MRLAGAHLHGRRHSTQAQRVSQGCIHLQRLQGQHLPLVFGQPRRCTLLADAHGNKYAQVASASNTQASASVWDAGNMDASNSECLKQQG